MDRVPDELGFGGNIEPGNVEPGNVGPGDGRAAFSFGATDGDDLVDRSAQRLQVPERLLNLAELEVLHAERERTLWAFMRPVGKPSFTRSMLGDFHACQQLVASHFGTDRLPLDFFVFASRTPRVFSFGGDLELFASLIREGDRAGLQTYGYRCVEILHRNFHALDLPMLTIGLAQGQALGGGFEALLTFDFVIAERGATFGLPEIALGLFPGMGAHVLLTRKLGSAMADRMILSNRTWTAEELYDLGLVVELAEPGQGVEATRAFIARSSRRHPGMVNAMRASRVAAPVLLEDLRKVVDLWADAALQLSPGDLKLMRRLSSTQWRLHASAA